MNQIENNLKRIRFLKNILLKETGNLLGMSSEEITKYEKEIILCDSAKLICFSKPYNVTPF